MMLPSLIGFSLFCLLPFIMTCLYGFVRSPFDFSFVGLSNILKTLRNDYFQAAFCHTALFTFVSVGVTMLLCIVLTFLFFQSRITFHGPIMLPVLLPTVAITLVWRTLFGDDSLLASLGMRAGVSLYTLFVWKNVGLLIIILLSALSQISRDMLEAAAIDGAGVLRRFKSIILPQLAPTLLFLCVYTIMCSFRIFRESYLLYGAYPDTSVFMVQHYIYNQFTKLHYPEVASAGMLYAFPIVLLVALLFAIQERTQEEKV